MSSFDAAVRLYVYESARSRRIPSPSEVADVFDRSPREIGEVFRRLQDDHDALVLLPDSPYIWMAEPFSAVPTDHPVVGESNDWFGNCIWDAFGIAALVGEACRMPTACPESGAELVCTADGGELTRGPGVVHFALPPARWWESIGFT